MSLLAAIGTIFLGGAALTNDVDVVCSASLAVDEAKKSGEISFTTDWPADVHWFGAYLRKGVDRYSIHPEPFVAGSYFAPEKPRGDGLNHFKFIVKPGFVREDMAQIRFRVRHTANPPRPDAAAIAALGKKPHPRLMLKSGDDVFARIKGATTTNELLAAAVRHLKVFADQTLGEPTVEYKLDIPAEKEKYLKTAVAFANAAGGRIIFGVEDQTWDVIGFPDDEVFQKMDAISNSIFDLQRRVSSLLCFPGLHPGCHL